MKAQEEYTFTTTLEEALELGIFDPYDLNFEEVNDTEEKQDENE